MLLSFLVLSAILSLASVEEAMQLYAGGKHAEARRMLEAITQSEPANFDAHFRLGLVALNAQDLSTAATSLNRASQLQPANAQVWLALAQTQRRRKTKVRLRRQQLKQKVWPQTIQLCCTGWLCFTRKSVTGVERQVSKAAMRLLLPHRDAVPRAVSFYLRPASLSPPSSCWQSIAKQKRLTFTICWQGLRSR